ncbi:hypothetical protein Godav_005565 [Gossypium davidsonii]|uniref:Uncharacterized protein n=2 Tax=Gossypium TaxID=3633 RepID=A0A7J8S0X1_GOSDV|nr:hypothetical protein [Gossypium davidsonii]MBA0655132.1 hypothetical protein [Gossypium klotzschianum]
MLPTQSLKEHVAILAFPFGSHDLTILRLACRLARAAPNVQFSFLTTAKSNDSIFSTFKLDVPNNIRAYNVEDGVPANDVFSGNPVERLDLFLKATPANFQKGLDVAVIYGRGHASFSDRVVVTKMVANSNQTLEVIPGLSPMHVRHSKETFFSYILSKIGCVLPRSTAIVMNFCQELYPTALFDDLKSMFPALLNVGFLTQELPLPPLPPSDSDATECLSWLDKQSSKSVEYISFGTAATPAGLELKALAEAVEERGIPYLWCLKDNHKHHLPNGFIKRISKQGKLVSTGVFVTHCGENSVFESVANGVPMIWRPMFGDHWMNGRVVEEIWGIGVKS